MTQDDPHEGTPHPDDGRARGAAGHLAGDPGPGDPDLGPASGDPDDRLAARGAAGPTGAPDGPGDPGGAPDLSDDDELDAALEAVLLVVDAPAPADQLADVLGEPVDRVTEALHRLAAGYARGGIDLRATGEGWRMHSRDRFAPYVERFVLDGQRTRLTRAALETLAVVAYRQPVTRTRVAAVRGVNVDGVMRTLTARGLITETGADPATGGTLYRTTELFLERLGLASLDDLPPLAPLLPDVDDIDEL